MNEHQKKYNLEHKKEIKEREKRYYQEHREEILRKQRDRHII